MPASPNMFLVRFDTSKPLEGIRDITRLFINFTLPINVVRTHRLSAVVADHLEFSEFFSILVSKIRPSFHLFGSRCVEFFNFSTLVTLPFLVEVINNLVLEG